MMNETSHCVSRRGFLKTAAGAAAMIGALGNPATASQHRTGMPTRPFGRSGIDVPILSFGGSLNTSLSTLLLRQAVKWGVTYWDTANTYMGGKSEKGMGKYLAKYPADRKRIFLVTKSHREFADRWKVRTTARPSKGVLKKWRSANSCTKHSWSWDKRGLQGSGQRA